MYVPPHRILAAFLVFVLLSASSFAADEDAAERVAEKAANTLGWGPPQRNADDSVPGTSFRISADGLGEDSEVKGYVTMLGSEPEVAYNFMILEQLDLEKSSFLGREARISKAGELCNPKGAITIAIRDWVQGFFEDIFGESEEDLCVQQHGVIVFSCGRYMIMAADETDEGQEADIASAFYSAAEEEGLCSFGETVVIMADTPDRPGSILIAEPQKMGQKVNEFYGVNSYAKLSPFRFSYRDNDGSRGHDDWYHMQQPLNSFNGQDPELTFGEAAIKEAFKGADLPQDLYLERAVIVFAGNSTQYDNTAIFSNSDTYEPNSYYVEVDALQGKKKVYVKNIIFLSENRELGGWVHEFGHSLHWKYTTDGYDRVDDRYNYPGQAWGQYGSIDYWGLMGSGSHWGPKDGDTPTQMSGFTKNGLGWTPYIDAAMNSSYELSSLESGGSVLKIDNPKSANPESYVLVEARDGSALFGAPESGVEIYQVKWGAGHHIVNSISPQQGSAAGEKDGKQYKKATLSATSALTRNPFEQWQVKLISGGGSPYSARVSLEPFVPANMVGAAAAPAAPPAAAGNPAQPGQAHENAEPDTMPDMDLHAYDLQGNHVGLDYSTMEYENEIPGAIASGDLKDDTEWIFVPEGTQVRYEVSTYKTQRFLQEHPQYAALVKPQEFAATYVKFDSAGNRYEAEGGNWSVAAGGNATIRSHDDPSLKYGKKELPGFGNNTCLPFAALLALLAFAAFRR